MKIAYISYEHPLGISGGGIGTYLGQIAKVMAERGHRVEVFTGHPTVSGTIEYDGYTVHRVQANNIEQFRAKVVQPFTVVHSTESFDIIESGEYGADGLLVKRQFPDIPLTIKLHTPTFLVSQLNGKHFGFLAKTIFLLKCLGKGVIKKPFWVYRKAADPEFALFQMADTSSSPSRSLRAIVAEKWGVEKEIAVVPLPFVPSEKLLSIPVEKRNPKKIVICFIGKLEVRKGVLILMKAIPEVARYSKHVVFRFIGEPLPSPKKGLNMQSYMLQELENYAEQIEFTGKQPAETIPGLIADAQICVFPSIWENFPNVCLESMAAGKVVIGTDNGGMADMITHGKNGLLVPPQSSKKLAQLIKSVIDGDYDTTTIGRQARERILTGYNKNRIGSLTEELYTETIRRKKMSEATVSMP